MPLSTLRSADEMPLSEEPYPSDDDAGADAEYEVRNFLLLALHQVIQRVGWIFKTESIVMPAFMDYIEGGPVLRGCLPVLNRLGFAIPPVIFSRRLKIMPRKKWAVAACTLAMAVPFAVLGFVWFADLWRPAGGTAYRWMPALFLSLYGLFFALVGMNQLAVHTLQGKLIRAERRGRLLTAATMVGAPLAILAAWWLMPGWLGLEDGGFGWLFGTAAVMFILAATTTLAIRESPDDFHEPSTSPAAHFRQAWQILVDDRDFRRLAVVAVLFGGSFMMFPHYQALGRERLGLGLSNLMLWVCAQNVATALASLLVGPLADRFGNRAALHVAILTAACAPLAALVLGNLPPDTARRIYWLVFLPIGATPIAIKLLANYTLEITTREHHPRYVSTVSMCLAAPVVFGAPLVGWLVQLAGYDFVFSVGTLVIGAAGVLTFWLVEPRHRG